MNLAFLPTAITVARLLSVVPLVWLLADRQFEAALWLALIAGFSDGLDGFLAKRYGWESRLGGGLDPLADKVLLFGAFISLAVLQVLPAWLAALVIGRDLVIVAGGLLYNYRIERVIPQPTLISKLNTTVQILLILFVLLRLAYGLPYDLDWPEIEAVIIIIVAVTTILSGMNYVWVWGNKALRHEHSGKDIEEL